jgi:hypothetical protein
LSANKQSPQRHFISPDAQLGLERLIVGRECNNFDSFSSERKTMAYLVLIKLGLIKATVTKVPGQSYPQVVIVSVTSLGRKTYQNQTNYAESSSGIIPKVLVFILSLGILVIIILKVFKKF